MKECLGSVLAFSSCLFCLHSPEETRQIQRTKIPKTRDFPSLLKVQTPGRENRMGGFRKGGFSNNRFVLKPDVAIASEVSILSKNSLAITDFHAKETQHVQLFENPLPGTRPHSRFPTQEEHVGNTRDAQEVLQILSLVLSLAEGQRKSICKGSQKGLVGRTGG